MIRIKSQDEALKEELLLNKINVYVLVRRASEEVLKNNKDAVYM
jgi:hypothetical protein